MNAALAGATAPRDRSVTIAALFKEKMLLRIIAVAYPLFRVALSWLERASGMDYA
jgi:hypothetical protein